MSGMGRAMAAFPAVFLAGAVALAWVWPWLLPVWIYLVPPLLHRLHDRVWPLREGAYPLVGPTYVPWWGSHQLQLVFVAFPALEALLRVLGLYSPWLRLWGSRVGRGVYWTPKAEVVDRGLLDLGDRVVVGHLVGFYSHMIKPVDGNLLLIVKRVRVGDGALIGAGSNLGPGAEVAAGAFVPVKTDVMPGKRFGEAS
jgi:hypothetical protein